MGIFVSKNIANFLVSTFNSSREFRGKLMPLPIGNMVSLVSRTGRHLQRYDKQGYRQVVGCIPYRYRDTKQCSTHELEVLVISSQKGKGMLFPKGGWEIDESIEEAASRETLEEAGVVGNVECRLGKWRYKSRSHGTTHEGYMFPMLVQKQLDLWPEKNNRERKWVSVGEAREMCQHWWMKEALDLLIDRQTQTKRGTKQLVCRNCEWL